MAFHFKQHDIDFRDVFDQFADPVFLFDTETGRFLYFNRAALKRYGYTYEEFLAITLVDLHPPQEREEALKNISDPDYTGPHQYLHITKNGKNIPVEIHSGFIRNGPKSIQISIVRDITERVKRAMSLQKSEERYRILSENVADGVMVLQDRRIVYANQALLHIFGYSHVDLYDMDPSQMVRESHREPFREFLRASPSGQRVECFQAPCTCEDGSEIWIEQRNNMIEWKGRPAVLATIRDITEARLREIETEEERECLRKENLKLKFSAKDRYRFGDIIGRSPAMQEVYELILKCSASDANIVIYGESGTGKELVARTIHAMSDAQQQPFVPVNCGAIPESLFESEFFGHRKGAFTGAVTDKHGYFDLAREGTLFLDEIGELPLPMQVKLLRAIDGGGYMPVGGTIMKEACFRILAATNRDLSEFVKKGQMREDFYYRIHIIPIHIPPLRERREDISLLVDHFIRSNGRRAEIMAIPSKIMDALCNYHWPGNVRELKNVLNRYLTMKRLDFLKSQTVQDTADLLERDTSLANDPSELREAIDAYEKSFILRTLEKKQWHRGRTADSLGIPPRTLHRKMKKYRLGTA